MAKSTSTKSAPEGSEAEVLPRSYPWAAKATNNTPIPIYLAEIGVHLDANFNAPANSADVIFPSADHYTREMANIEAIGKVHDFVDVLLLTDMPADSTAE